ncbi:MAG TPA: PLP-dependent aminotransferase family protein [Longimicrobiaceae bacterium]|nr:PLP-dependent aminotransferase family protein [Longimicrobiaceae bacterium]
MILAAPPEPREKMRTATWARTIKPSVINEMLALTARPDIVSFALGLPAPELFPREAYARAAERVLATDPRALQYGPSYRPLKAQIAELMKRRGVECRPEQVVLTSGAHQALSILSRFLLDPGGQVLLERVAYTGFQQVIEPFQPELLVVPTGLDHGINVDAVEAYLASGATPAFMYVVSDGHNPLGVSISRESRDRLVELARRYGVPIVEDDAYGLLHYDDGDAEILPMRAQEDRWVFYVGSFSKILAPGARIGWIIAPEELARVLSGIKDTCDLDMNTFAQRTVSAFIEDGNLDGHVEMLREEYRARRDLMDAMLRAHFPAGTRWRVPSNGALIWAELPEEIDCGKLLPVAVETERVAYVPGHAFASDGTRYARNCMRLNFSFPGRAEIEQGMKALGRVLRAERD